MPAGEFGSGQIYRILMLAMIGGPVVAAVEEHEPGVASARL